ncbi:MAG TPA: nucleotide sugar dehydrogenase, partial [Allosphingosinicella sp.]
GYVGLPIALMLARSGLRTGGYDIDRGKMDRLRSGQCPINEPALSDIFYEVIGQRDIRFLDRLAPSDNFLIAVPTPLRERRKTADLTALRSALESIVPVLRKGNLVIINSTCPVMTCRGTAVPILEQSGLKVDEDFLLAYCPERLYPGNIAYEIVHNEHIIGGHSPEATDRAVALYERFVASELIRTDDRTAEFCKLIENTYRDVNIALANELRAIAQRFGTDIEAAIDIANRHPRVNLLKPGIGVGGHCLPIDPWFIVEMAPEESRLIPTARRINDEQPHLIAAEIRRSVASQRDAAIGCYGVTYKPDVNDERESPAWEIIGQLREEGYDVRPFDPVVNVGDYSDLDAFIADVDLVVALVEHDEFRRALAAGRFDGKRLMRFES